MLATGAAAVEVGGGLFEHVLDGEAVGLTLPADEWGAVIFQEQRPAGHAPSTGAGGDWVAAQEGGRVERRAARELDAVSLIAPVPQATVRASSSTMPGAPDCVGRARGQDLQRRAAEHGERAGPGVEGAHLAIDRRRRGWLQSMRPSSRVSLGA